MNEPTIPPPSEADLKVDKLKAYQCCALLPDPGGEVVACFIRLLHAAELRVDELEAAAHAERRRAVEIALTERGSLLAWSRTCTDDDDSRRSFIECANTANNIANAICPTLAEIIRNASPTPSEK